MLAQESSVAPPPRFPSSAKRSPACSSEATAFFGERPAGLVLVAIDPQSLRAGKFRVEHVSREAGGPRPASLRTPFGAANG
jgi:hypothetical protein